MRSRAVCTTKTCTQSGLLAWGLLDKYLQISTHSAWRMHEDSCVHCNPRALDPPSRQDCAQRCHKDIPLWQLCRGFIGSPQGLKPLGTLQGPRPCRGVLPNISSPPRQRPIGSLPWLRPCREIRSSMEYAMGPTFAATLHACMLLSDGVPIRFNPFGHVLAVLVII